MRTLVVTGERAVADDVCAALAAHGHTCEHTTRSEGVTTLAVGADVVLVDLDMPDAAGRAVCRQLRAASGVPVLALVARDEAHDRVGLLALGIDDYVVKPIDRHQLRGRVDAIIGRAPPAR